MRRRVSFIWLVLIFTLGLSACNSVDTEEVLLTEIDIESDEEEKEKETSEDTIFVYVCGAVVNEGVYELPKGSRGYEAIDMAGGFTDAAAKTAVDQAAVLDDEITLYVPNYSELVASQAEEEEKVNLNTASKEELMTLPGVGESKADSILSYREENGGFKAVEEIMNISGIKEGLFEKVKDYITI